jgi:hypothetical protein
VYSRISCTIVPDIAEAIDPFGVLGVLDKEDPSLLASLLLSGRAKERKEAEWSPHAWPVFPLRAARAATRYELTYARV